MSVPHGGRGPANPMDAMRARTGDNFFYMVYHNEAGGVAEAEYDSDPRGFLSRIYLSRTHRGSHRKSPTRSARQVAGFPASARRRDCRLG